MNLRRIEIPVIETLKELTLLYNNILPIIGVITQTSDHNYSSKIIDYFRTHIGFGNFVEVLCKRN